VDAEPLGRPSYGKRSFFSAKKWYNQGKNRRRAAGGRAACNPYDKHRRRKTAMLTYKFDTQLLIEGHDLSEDGIGDYITKNMEGDCLLAVGDEDLIKIHFHTNVPWKVLEYCASLGDIFDVVIENMDRQERGLQA